MTPAAATVVVLTRDRREMLLATLRRLQALPGRPPVVVVDNASSDGTPDAVQRSAPWVDLLPLDRNAGGAGRTLGARRAATPYVAFCDDDSWWEPSAIPRACAFLDRHPRAALVAGRVLVGPERRADPVSRQMDASPLPPGDSPGTAVLGFLSCAAIVRRDPFLAVGGFEERLGIGGEEQLLAIDLARAGWDLVYLPDVVAHHHPAPRADGGWRRRRVQARNAVWCAWLRRPPARAVRLSAALGWRAVSDTAVLRGLADAVARGGWVLRSRRVVPPALEHRLRMIDDLRFARGPDGAGR